MIKENKGINMLASKEKFIIAEIKELINLKNLETGDKLPSERLLAERFNVTRGNIRNAIQKLEFYGLLKSMPQSGTFVADLDKTAMNGMIDQILDLPTPDFKSLVETRIFLELKIVKFAAARHTDQNLTDIEEALTNYTTKTLAGEDSVAEDLLFHLAIAKASHNSSLNRLMLSITPQIITDFEKFHVCKNNTAISAIEEHKAIVDAIRKKDPTLAEAKMKEHFTVLYQYCYET
jgi:GntR family transcriptional regulator, transcriptional repressor for pyruvate dehydrogenase complex